MAIDTLAPVPNQPKTPNRVVRVDDELWEAYGQACEAEGHNRAEDIRDHMRRKVATWKRRQRQGRDQG
jgi:hypothetical protein